jgi:hypothetical protein
MTHSKGTFMTSTTSRSRLLRPALAVLALGGALTLAACAAPTTESPQTSSTQAPEQVLSPGGGGVSGLIAAASDGVLQVQSPDEQTAVRYTDETTVSSQVAGALGDVSVGSCVTALTPADADAAASVMVTDAVDGECNSGPGGGFVTEGGGPGAGGPPDGAPTDFPTDFPTDGTAPDGAPTDAPDIGAFASGLVTEVSGDTITVDAVDPDGATTATDVTVDAETDFTVTVDADAGALVVGQCVAAQGEADDAGGFSATSLIVSEPGDDGCTPRFTSGQGGPGAIDGSSESGPDTNSESD